jgi:hypothetical protein
MRRRDIQITRSITSAIQQDDEVQARQRPQFWKAVKTFFAVWGLLLVRIQPDLFRKLRQDTFKLSDDEYGASISGDDALVSKGGMGYSGLVRLWCDFSILRTYSSGVRPFSKQRTTSF